ncbi:hypothetical protein HY489_05555 [Candidatus Woesearchaeota archaeon]|nr:hypothetical protein [Candidatus Woesearchaeota archaeon]
MNMCLLSSQSCWTLWNTRNAVVDIHLRVIAAQELHAELARFELIRKFVPTDEAGKRAYLDGLAEVYSHARGILPFVDLRYRSDLVPEIMTRKFWKPLENDFTANASPSDLFGSKPYSILFEEIKGDAGEGNAIWNVLNEVRRLDSRYSVGWLHARFNSHMVGQSPYTTVEHDASIAASGERRVLRVSYDSKCPADLKESIEDMLATIQAKKLPADDPRARW